MAQSSGLRLVVALASGALVWRILLQALFFTGGVENVGLAVITLLSTAFAVFVFRGPGLRALVALASGALAWRILLQALFFTGGMENVGLAVITLLSTAFAVFVFRRFPKRPTPVSP